jgi:hypothetical protein
MLRYPVPRRLVERDRSAERPGHRGAMLNDRHPLQSKRGRGAKINVDGVGVPRDRLWLLSGDGWFDRRHKRPR